jgi:nucleotide-binding universal stress UspA family protein
MLRWALSRVPLRKAEKERLEREEMEAKGFVPQLERLLLAVDHSPNGQFASRLGGLLAGNRGIPITVLPLSAKAANGMTSLTDDKGETETVIAKKGEATSKEAVKTAAEDTKSKQPKDEKPDSVDVTVRMPDAPTPEAVAREAEKGYDVLFVGIAGMRAKDGDEISELAGKYQQEIETAIRADLAPDRAVVAEAKKNGHTLIVMGVGRRPGDRLFFGDTAVGILKDAPISVMLVAS